MASEIPLLVFARKQGAMKEDQPLMVAECQRQQVPAQKDLVRLMSQLIDEDRQDQGSSLVAV